MPAMLLSHRSSSPHTMSKSEIGMIRSNVYLLDGCRKAQAHCMLWACSPATKDHDRPQRAVDGGSISSMLTHTWLTLCLCCCQKAVACRRKACSSLGLSAVSTCVQC